jgi:serine/threonine-protein kinase
LAGANGAEDLTAAADIYTLGCVVFECLAGRPPCDGPRGVQMLTAHRREPSPDGAKAATTARRTARAGGARDRRNRPPAVQGPATGVPEPWVPGPPVGAPKDELPGGYGWSTWGDCTDSLAC